MDNFNRLKEYINEQDKFCIHNGIKISEVKEGYAAGFVKISENSLNPHGKVNGGLIYSLADVIAGVAATSHGRMCLTLNGTVSYLKPGSGNHLYAYTEELKCGKTTAVYNVYIKDENNNLVSECLFTMFYVDKKFE